MDANAVVDWNGLKNELGWPFSRTHTARLMAKGLFARCFKLDKNPKSKNLWRRADVLRFFKPPS